MTSLFPTFKKTPYLILIIGLSIAFFAIYTFFDLRQGGTHLTVYSTHLMSFQFFVDHFGLFYVIGRIVLDLLLSVLSAALLAITIDRSRNDHALFAGGVCSPATTIFLGLTTFGCPSCVLPIAGTFGLVFTAQTLPLFGFEFKLLALAILCGTFIWLTLRTKQTLPEQIQPLQS